MLALGDPGERKCSTSIYVAFCSYLVQHPCHHIAVTLMGNTTDALLRFPTPLRYILLCSFSASLFLWTTQTITASDRSV